jgi:hypothetical protein
MPDHLDTALCFAGRARRERQPSERERFTSSEEKRSRRGTCAREYRGKSEARAMISGIAEPGRDKVNARTVALKI